MTAVFNASAGQAALACSWLSYTLANC